MDLEQHINRVSDLCMIMEKCIADLYSRVKELEDGRPSSVKSAGSKRIITARDNPYMRVVTKDERNQR